VEYQWKVQYSVKHLIIYSYSEHGDKHGGMRLNYSSSDLKVKRMQERVSYFVAELH
jgi:hypothetical protein